MRDRREELVSHLSNHETTLLSFFSVQGSSRTAVGVFGQSVSSYRRRRLFYRTGRYATEAVEPDGGVIPTKPTRRSRFSAATGPLS